MWFDTHAHLSDSKFDADRSAVLERAFQRGLAGIVEIADGPAEWPKARALAEAYPERVWWAAGLHPYYADQATTETWEALRRAAQHPRFVALGEVGLDYAKSTIAADLQKRVFERAIEVALAIRKPLVVHCRNAFSDLIPILRRFFPTPPQESPGVIHCFSGSAADAAAVLASGFYIGVDAPIMYPASKALRETLAAVPTDRLLLETDCPYLPPQTHRGQRNEPSYLPLIGATLAEIKKLSVSALADALILNSCRFYRINLA